MLIESPRLTPRDLEAWENWERYDLALGASLNAAEKRAVNLITKWWNGDGICSVSWGKDSTVVAHLVALTGLPIPIVWVRSDPFEMPESEHVRDHFLHAHPGIIYEERVAMLHNPKRGQAGYEEHQSDPNAKHQDVLKELIKEPYISGVRAEESKMRRNSARWHGEATEHTCRPILRWTATDVFSYLATRCLPVHPAYAMTFGGKLDRRWIRVHPLCSHHEESGVHGRDSASWEDAYWGDHIATVLAAHPSPHTNTTTK